MARHVALVGKTTKECGIGKRDTFPDQGANSIEASHDEISIWAGTEACPKMPCQRVPGEPGNRFQLYGGYRLVDTAIEVLARIIDAAQVNCREPSSRRRRVSRCQGFRQFPYDPIELQIFQRHVKIVECRHDRISEDFVVRYSVAHEWKGTTRLI